MVVVGCRAAHAEPTRHLLLWSPAKVWKECLVWEGRKKDNCNIHFYYNGGLLNGGVLSPHVTHQKLGGFFRKGKERILTESCFLPLVNPIFVQLGLGQWVEEEEEGDEAQNENAHEKEPGLGLVIPEFHDVREAHEVAETVAEDRGGQVARPEEKKGRVHAEHGRVRHLKEPKESGGSLS